MIVYTLQSTKWMISLGVVFVQLQYETGSSLDNVQLRVY